MSMPKKTNESGYPIGDPSRSMLRYIDSPDGGQGVNGDGPKVVAGEGMPAEPPAAPPAAPEQPKAPATPPAPPADADAPKAPAAADTPPWGKPEDFDPEKAWKLIQGLRDDKKTNEQRIADARSEATTQAQKDLVTKWAKELGVIEDPKDPEALLTAVTQDRDGLKQKYDGTAAENRALKVENAVHRVANRLKANMDEVLDSKELDAKFQKLDPAADDFASQVENIVAEAVQKNPTRYGTAQVAPVSGGDFTSGNGGGPKAPADDDNDIEKAREAAVKRRNGR